MSIRDFNLVDQLNQKVDLGLLKNKVVIADFFFVSCPSICPIMTNNLNQVHTQFKNNKDLLILSHTVWPEMDSVNILYDYAKSSSCCPIPVHHHCRGEERKKDMI